MAKKKENIVKDVPKQDGTQISYYMASMLSITLKNGTRISFAENISYEQAFFDLEALRQILEIKKQSEPSTEE